MWLLSKGCNDYGTISYNSHLLCKQPKLLFEMHWLTSAEDTELVIFVEHYIKRDNLLSYCGVACIRDIVCSIVVNSGPVVR